MNWTKHTTKINGNRIRFDYNSVTGLTLVSGTRVAFEAASAKDAAAEIRRRFA